MCGIFGSFTRPGPQNNPSVSSKNLARLLSKLFMLSEARGKEASGLAVATPNHIHLLKAPVPGSRLIRQQPFKDLISRVSEERALDPTAGLAIIGHSRLVTDGCQGLHANNQPVSRDGMVLVHNGIVVNTAALWAKYPHLTRAAQVDTEIIPALLRHFIVQGQPLPQAVRSVFGEIQGETSIAVLFSETNQLLLATNTGSLSGALRRDNTALCFASEAYIVRQIMADRSLLPSFADAEFFHVPAGTAQLVTLDTLTITRFPLSKKTLLPEFPQIAPTLARHRHIEDRIAEAEQAREHLRRCTRCVLPETMPFITFNAEGVCSYCQDYQADTLLPKTDLDTLLSRFRKTNGQPDTLVAFSGGRDSCYGLHLLKTELDMTPIAYTYDWGMVTDLGRRNQARVCGKLGVEHIWVSADIRAKRNNIRRNVEAWMKKPDLGIIPLFMAGDKQFFYYANQAIRQTGIPLMMFCSNKLEKTDFKIGFCGIPPYRKDPSQPHHLGKSGKFGLLGYYFSQFLQNPAYWNASIPDTLSAYASYYLMKRDFTYLFDYLPWEEDVINDLLLNEYDWELAPDTRTTWRIGDGTAPFYNYIYYTVAGFTEHDTFRSNQIREGVLTRDEALRLVHGENQPRWQSLREYAQLIRIDFDEFLRVVHAMPKRYDITTPNMSPVTVRPWLEHPALEPFA